MHRVFAAVLVVTCGCSFVAVRSAPRRPSGECAGYVPAIVDAVFTATIIALAARSYVENHCEGECHNYDPTGLYAIPALGFGASTAWGFGAMATCRAAAGR